MKLHFLLFFSLSSGGMVEEADSDKEMMTRASKWLCFFPQALLGISGEGSGRQGVK
jgi:hypothetical protein